MGKTQFRASRPQGGPREALMQGWPKNAGVETGAVGGLQGVATSGALSCKGQALPKPKYQGKGSDRLPG